LQKIFGENIANKKYLYSFAPIKIIGIVEMLGVVGKIGFDLNRHMICLIFFFHANMLFVTQLRLPKAGRQPKPFNQFKIS